eukprot:352374-Chlamydomonas_euryale.AAC.8
MIGFRAAGNMERRRRPCSGATLLQSMGRLVHMGSLPTACRHADVLIHARESPARRATQRRHAAAPASRERSPWAEFRAARCPIERGIPLTEAECSFRGETLRSVSDGSARKCPRLSPGWNPESFSSANAKFEKL